MQWMSLMAFGCCNIACHGVMDDAVVCGGCICFRIIVSIISGVEVKPFESSSVPQNDHANQKTLLRTSKPHDVYQRM